MKRASNNPVNGAQRTGEREEGELAPGAGDGTQRRKNRGGRRRGKGDIPEKTAKDGPLFKKAALEPPSPVAAPPSLLNFISPLLVSSTADPLLLANTAAHQQLELQAAAPPSAEPETKILSTSTSTATRPQREFIPHKVCSYYLKGRCDKGDKCTFSHAVEVPRKLEVCKFFKTGVCRKTADECKFSHDYRTEICLYVLRNSCTAGNNCKYSHDREALASGKISGPPLPPTGAPAVATSAPSSSSSLAASSVASVAVPPVMSVRSSAPHTLQPLVIALSESSEDGEASS